MKKSIFRRIKDMVGGNSSGSTTLTFSLGVPQFYSQTYRTFVLEGYARNPTLFACLDLIARSVGDLKWCLYDSHEDNPDRKPIADHPLLDLMRRPDPRISKAEFLARTVLHMYLEGDAFHYLNTPTVGRKRFPRELNILRPDRVYVSPELDGMGNYKFRYVGNNGQEKIFSYDEIIQHQFYNPLDDYNGLSPLSALAHSTDISNAGRKWNYSLLKNAVQLSSWFVVEGNLSEEQQSAIKEQVAVKYAGADNAGKPMLLEAGMEYKLGAWSPKDMDWVKSINLSDEDIMRALHVPPELLGVTQARTYANFEQARKVFYGDVVLPLGRKLRDVFNLRLAPLFGDGVYLDLDENKITALQEDQDKKHSRVRDDYSTGIVTLTEARTEIGLKKLTPEQMDELYQRPASPQSDPSNPNDPNYDSNLDPNADPEDGTTEGKSFSPQAKARRRQRFELVEGYRKRFEKFITEEARTQFKSEDQRLSELLLKQNESTILPAVEELVKHSFEGEWAELLSKVFVRVVKTIGQSELEEIRKIGKSKANWNVKTIFDPHTDAIRQQIALVVTKSKNEIAKTTLKKISAHVADGIAAGKSIPEIADLVKGLYATEMTASRSELIGRTVSISSVNFAGQQVAKQSGVKLKKEWISTIDGRERKPHGQMDGRQQDIALPWIVDGEKMMFPGDVSLGASPGNTIQCRCAEGYVPADES